MTKYYEELLQKIENKTAVVGVVGLGYVGLPLAVEKAKAGFKTIGFDVQDEKVQMVNEGHNYIGDVVDEDLAEIVSNGLLTATTDFSEVASADFIAICVPTPLDKYQQPDISYVEKSTTDVGKHLKPSTIVVLESTTYPGTTEELLKPILERESGLKSGEDFFVAFSPERVDPGNKTFNTKNTPKVVGGIGKEATKLAASMYRQVLGAEVHEVSSPAVAEMEKILENTYRNINIALVNEMAIISDRMGINIWEVIEAAKTKPYGFQAFYPGPGLGGHCIPLDPYYLTYKAREFDYHTKLIETSGEINKEMPYWTVERTSKILNQFKKPLNGSNVLMLGMAYKNDINDYRESPAIDVYEIFKKNGADVEYYDPYITEVKTDNGEILIGLDELTKEKIKSSDIVVITTAHEAYDYQLINENAIAIFDTRNAMKDITNRSKIELL